MLAGDGLPPPCTAVKVSAGGKTDNRDVDEEARPVSLKIAAVPSPVTLAKTVNAPAAVGVAVIWAFPSKPVETNWLPRVAPPDTTLNATSTPLSGEPDASVTSTMRVRRVRYLAHPFARCR